ncbi:Nramp family divalent metal transporter [Salinigranum halophilum]|uniref:Nramp family divalent metal transporter n=1 Tax=Salinigranum halophilum TaxID=2565931 RepID=UPI0010A81D64|nr:Nramp family divalent metal transporter [Salinigranum halophilum]
MNSGESPSDAADDAEPDVYASEVEGRQYRGTSYMPMPYDDLVDASDTDAYPERGEGGSFKLLDLPRVPKLSHVVGPSAIMLGASLGSGETLFWPVLIAQGGWALYWAFWIGVLTQFFVNTELQRWTIATGESVFRAFDRVSRFWPLFFLLAGFVSLGWPGWAASAAQVGSWAFGLADWQPLGIGLMVLIFLSYQLSPVMYNVVEGAQFVLVVVSILGAVTLAVVTGSTGQLANLPAGAVAIGTIPAGTDLAVFLGGLAFAGAGGYLNLSQSLWVREKGYGMGNYQGRLKNPLIGDDPEPIQEDGFTFEPTEENLLRWRGWWRVIQLEHLLTFVVGLLVVATMLMTVAAEFASGSDAAGIDMWLTVVVPQLSGTGQVLVPLVLFVALFTTEYAIVESFVRNSADIVYETHGRQAGWSLPTIFLVTLTAFTLWGVVIILLPFDQPFFLLVVGAAMSGVMMWPYIALTLVINTTRLPPHLQPGWIRVVAMWWATGFFGYFSTLLIGRTLARDFGVVAFETAPGIVGSGPAGYVLWLGYLVVQAYTVAVTLRAKRDGTDTAREAADVDRGWLS